LQLQEYVRFGEEIIVCLENVLPNCVI